jgi:hypothetical protein
MQVQKMLSIIIVMGVIATAWGGAARADLINGDFSSGLDDWVYEGNVSVESSVCGDNTFARLVDLTQSDNEEIWYSNLYQVSPLPKGSYTLHFDLWPMLFGTEGYGTFPDFFAVNLYFISETTNFDLFNNSYNSAFSVLNLNGIVVGLDAWSHYSYTFQNQYSAIIPVFEFIDYNYPDVPASQVLIDNVTVNPVPEPATIMLFATGLIGLGGLARRRIKRQFRFHGLQFKK